MVPDTNIFASQMLPAVIWKFLLETNGLVLQEWSAMFFILWTWNEDISSTEMCKEWLETWKTRPLGLDTVETSVGFKV